MLRSFFVAAGALATALYGPALACSGKLGVSRTVKLETTGGPLHGGLQYKTESFLRDREVVLTFDDGPLRTNTRQVLAALKAHCTKATFFMVGRMAVADPAMVREVADQGHTIATHTWSHKNLHRWSESRMKGEIELGISAIEHALGKPIAPFFRFPYLADPKSAISYLQGRDQAIFSIDVDSYDYRTRSGDTVRLAVMRQLSARGKGIMLFHDIQISTARAMPALLDELHEKGYKVVHIEPANTVATIAAYDAQAEALHAKRRYSGDVVPVGAGGRAESSTSATASGTTSRASATGTRNPQQVRRRLVTKPTGQPAAPRAVATSDDNWRRQILGN
jgi:peptidoglycan/xylan/chitin deacetylase (PgdA/CDA1 family)